MIASLWYCCFDTTFWAEESSDHCESVLVMKDKTTDGAKYKSCDTGVCCQDMSVPCSEYIVLLLPLPKCACVLLLPAPKCVHVFLLPSPKCAYVPLLMCACVHTIL